MTAIANGGKLASKSTPNYGLIRSWLIVVAAMVVGMIVLGGATRLTGSGLSITEWKPIRGTIPPLSNADWAAEFERYRQIPQYVKLNLGMSLDEFKFIYWWEWSHRLLGRLIGFAFFLPMLAFWLMGWLKRELAWKLVGLLVLGGSQGALGWWMVASGLAGRTEVSQYRLAMHLTLACIILSAIVWVASSLTKRPDEASLPRLAKAISVLLVPLVLTQIFLGGLVAGLRAGLSYNTWPLMDGHFIPSLANLYVMTPSWANHFENALTVQFQHRMVAYCIVALALAQAFLVIRHGSGQVRNRAVLIAAIATGQAAIGVMSLLLEVPLWSGILHQLGGVVLLAAVTVHVQRMTAASGNKLVAAR